MHQINECVALVEMIFGEGGFADDLSAYLSLLANLRHAAVDYITNLVGCIIVFFEKNSNASFGNGTVVALVYAGDYCNVFVFVVEIFVDEAVYLISQREDIRAIGADVGNSGKESELGAVRFPVCSFRGLLQVVADNLVALQYAYTIYKFTVGNFAAEGRIGTIEVINSVNYDVNFIANLSAASLALRRHFGGLSCLGGFFKETIFNIVPPLAMIGQLA